MSILNCTNIFDKWLLMASIRSTGCPKKLQIKSVHCPGSKNFYGKIQFQTKESLLTNQNDILILYFN